MKMRQRRLAPNWVSNGNLKELCWKQIFKINSHYFCPLDFASWWIYHKSRKHFWNSLHSCEWNDSKWSCLNEHFSQTASTVIFSVSHILLLCHKIVFHSNPIRTVVKKITAKKHTSYLFSTPRVVHSYILYIWAGVLTDNLPITVRCLLK